MRARSQQQTSPAVTLSRRKTRMSEPCSPLRSLALLLSLALTVASPSALAQSTGADAADAATLPPGELPAAAPEAGADADVPVSPPDPAAEELTAFVEHGMQLWNLPGAAVAVVGSDAVRFQRGFGHAEYLASQPVDEHTLFAIASTTKAMIAAAILMLADEGKLALDDPVTRHIPELHFSDPLLTSQITLRDLLAHRTGLPSTDFWTFFQEMPLQEQIERLGTVEPAGGLRAQLIYQNTMFALAGLLIERVSGKRWDALLAEWLWHPIGMFETFGARSQVPDDRTHVTPHLYADGALSVAPWDLPEDAADAAGSVWSSLHDMSLWAQFLLRGGLTADGRRLISAERFAEMFEPQQLVDAKTFYPTTELTRPRWRGYGLGWFLQDFQGRKIEYHTGSLSGLIALVGLDRERDRAVIVLGNRDHAEFRHALLWHVFDESDKATQPDWNQAVFDLYQRRDAEREAEWTETRQKRLANANPGLPLEAYIGSYHSEVNGDVVVGRNGRRLQLRTARITLEMRHWHLDTFLVEYEPWNLREFATFRIGTDGSVAALEILGDRFERLDPEPPPLR